MTIATRAGPSWWIKYVSRSRVDRSAQWMSSTITSTGRSRASRSNRPSNTSKRRVAPPTGSIGPSSPVAPITGSGRPDARGGELGHEATELAAAGPAYARTAVAPSSRTRVRSISTIGPNGGPPSPRSMHVPLRTRTVARIGDGMGDLTEQAGLADTGLATDDDGGRLARGRPCDRRGFESGERLDPTDKGRTRDPRRHR